MKKIVLLTLFFSVIFIYNASAKYNQLTLGSETFCIPKKFDTLDQTTGPLFNLPGLDSGLSGGSFQTPVNAADVQKNISEYALKHGGLYSNLMINIRRASGQELERWLNNKREADVLLLSHDYEDAYVQHDEKNNLYNVSNWGSPPPFIVWSVLKMKPHKEAIIPEHLDDYFVALCSSMGGVDGINEIGSSCDYSLEIDGYFVNIGTTGNNLSLKEKINAFVKNVLTTWRENCD